MAEENGEKNGKGIMGRVFPGSQSKTPGKQDGGPPRPAPAGSGADLAGSGAPAEGTTGDRWEGSRAHRS